jgi:hypothetical protein
MSWTDQDPPANDVLLQGNVYTSSGRRLSFEIDRFVAPGLDRTLYRATVGNLFCSEEVARHHKLEDVLRWLMLKSSTAI